MERTVTHEAQRGISLVEALVALLVMSVGMLGIASLYVTGLKTGRSALTRTHAVNLVNDLADRIRANSSAQGAYSLADSQPELPQPPDCATQSCSAADIAENDLANWRTALRDVLPSNAVGKVEYQASADGVGRPDDYRITVSWREPGETADFKYAINMKLIAVRP